jgi:hypothetical protein
MHEYQQDLQGRGPEGDPIGLWREFSKRWHLKGARDQQCHITEHMLTAIVTDVVFKSWLFFLPAVTF